MKIYIRDWALIIAALILASAMLFDDPTRSQPLVALAYITLAIMIVGHYFKSLRDEETEQNKDNENKQSQPDKNLPKEKQILNEKK